MRTLLLVLPLLALAACVHRYPVRAGADREVVAGLPVTLGEVLEPLPPETSVSWDFGDGTSAQGQQVTHAWARAGEFRVRLTVTDPRGARTAEAVVRAVRRPPAAALPSSTRIAVVVDRLFARLPKHLAVAERLAGPERVQAFLAPVAQALGFDPTSAEQVAQAGLDPDEGVALAWLPNDTGVWMVLGVADEQAALAAAQKALGRVEPVDFAPGPEGSSFGVVGKARIHLLARGGYLYVHLAEGSASEPNFAALRESAVEGLHADAAFAKARAQVPGEDLFVFVRGSELPAPKALTGDLAELQRHVAGLAAGFSNRGSELTLAARATFDAEGEKALAGLFTAPGRVSLESQAPLGAVGWASLSLAAPVLSRWIQEGAHQNLDAALTDLAGLTAAGLGELVSGGVALVAYFDQAAMLAEVLGQGKQSKVKVLAALGVKDPMTARAGLTKGVLGGKLRVAGEGRWEVGETGALALVGDVAWLGDRQVLTRALAADPHPRLAPALQAAVPAASLAPGHQVVWLDVATFLDQLRSPPEAGGLDGPRQAQLGAMLSAMVEQVPELQPLQPIRDFWADLHPEGAALVFDARLRLRE